MVIRVLARHIATLVLALGVFLGGAAPSWAMLSMSGTDSMPAGMAMTMPGMVMQNAHSPSLEKGTSQKDTPCKGSNACCAICAACALPVALIQDTSSIVLSGGQTVPFPEDVNRNGLAILPALPPPILYA
jgi:hypothetical protein